MIDKNKIGLAVGFFMALAHAVWSLCVAVIPSYLQTFLDWVFKLHAIEPVWILTAFNFMNAILLVIVTFIFGYIVGFVFAWLHNLVHKKK